MKQRLYSYAKLNLALEVGCPLPNGYHPIRSLFRDISLCDEMLIEWQAEGHGFELECSTVELGEETTLHKVYALVSEYLARPLPGRLCVHLDKRIPMGAGLGGGSSNAAVLLMAMNEMLDLDLSQDELRQIAVKVGADVPYFLHGGLALVQGIGEKISSLDASALPYTGAVLIFPGVAVSSAAAYTWLDEDEAWMQWEPGSDAVVSEQLFAKLGFNSFVLPVAKRVEELDSILSLCEGMGDLVYMSGSGSTLYRPFTNREEGEAWMEVLRVKRPLLRLQWVDFL